MKLSGKVMLFCLKIEVTVEYVLDCEVALTLSSWNQNELTDLAKLVTNFSLKLTLFSQ